MYFYRKFNHAIQEDYEMINLSRILPAVSLLATSFILPAQPSIGGFHVYYGHLHNHSEVSDGVHSPQAAYRDARETGHLDFFGLSDHSEQIHGDEWQRMKEAADTYNRPGEYTTFRGFEWTDDTQGHVTVVHADDFTTPALCNYSFSSLCQWLEQHDCIAFFNHPGRYNSTGHEFEHFQSPVTDRLVGIELWNRSDRFEQYYHNNGYFASDGNVGFYDEALQQGWLIGAAGGEDNHSGNWGQTTDCRLAVLASENTRDHLYQALKARRFFSTYDQNMRISFRIDGHEMGSEVYAGNQSLHIEAEDGEQEPFSSIELVRNGSVIQSWSPLTDRVNIQQSIQCGPGDYYYLHVMQHDGDEAVTSPIRVSRLNRVPETRLLLPLPNSHFLHSAAVTLVAQADDPDGTIEKVEFYNDNQLLGHSDSSPYTYTWQCTSTGTFRIRVIATDNRGGQGVSSPVSIVVTNPGEPVTVCAQIVTGMDDVEESSAGSISGNRQSTDIELVDDYGTRGENQHVGLRFTDLNIPRGVYILQAHVQFTCDETNSAACELTISGEAAGDAAPFGMDPYNVSSREPTRAKVPWMPDPWPVEGQADVAQRTPNVKNLVQEIINRADYQPGGAISLLFNGHGTRTAVAYEGSEAHAPAMVVTYSYTKPNDPPRVKLTAPPNETTRMAPATVLLSAQALDEDGQIEKVAFYQGDSLLHTAYQAPYSFEWTRVPEDTYLLKAIATDDKGDTAHSSVVTLEVLPEVVSRTFATFISSAADDAEESYNGAVRLNGDDIELVYDSRRQGRQTVGLRFNKVDIPRQALIKKAVIQFTAHEKTTDGCSLAIQGEDADDSRTFNTLYRDISGRNRTVSTVSWIAPRWARKGQCAGSEQTTDLKTIVQEIINRPGWTQGNSLSFIITGLGLGKRTAVSYDTSFQKASRLVVQYDMTIYRKKGK